MRFVVRGAASAAACLSLSACVSVASCTPGPCVRRIIAPAQAQVNGRVSVAAEGSCGSGVQLQWSATGGRFEGVTNEPTAVFVPTAAGSVTVVLTIRSSDGVTAVKDATIQASLADARPDAAPAVANPAGQPRPAPIDIDNIGYVPSGFMGDGGNVNLDRRSDKLLYLWIDTANRQQPHSPPSAHRIGYKPGPVGWAAVAWQNPGPDGQPNWGDFPGRDLAKGFQQLSVWARAEPDQRTGAFPRVQFKAGGNTESTKRYQASFAAAGDVVTLTGEWTQYFVSLARKDLSSVVSAFTIVVRAQDVPVSGATIFIDDIEYR